MSIATVRDAIATTLGALAPVGDSETAAHKQALRDAVRKATKHHAVVRVAYLATQDAENEGGSIATKVTWGAFIVTRTQAPGDERDKLALIVLAAVIKAVANAGDWGTGLASSPERIRSTNLGSEKFDERNISAIAVTWDQKVELSDDEEVDALDPFLSVHADYETGDDPEAQDIIELDQ